jgi:AMP nucleosidase
MDDAIANGTLKLPSGTPEPLALFRAARVDYSLHRLYHYTGTDPEHFQNFVIFTNYQFYVDMFARLSREHMASGHADSEALRCGSDRRTVESPDRPAVLSRPRAA